MTRPTLGMGLRGTGAFRVGIVGGGLVPDLGSPYNDTPTDSGGRTEKSLRNVSYNTPRCLFSEATEMLPSDEQHVGKET